MTTVDAFVKEALGMPPKDRAAIVQRLIVSLDDRIDIEVEESWQLEVQNRLEDLDKGGIVCRTWEEVRDELKKRR